MATIRSRPRPDEQLVSIGFNMFIDRPHIRKKLNAATEWVYAKTGGFVRTTMQRGIRPPKKYTRDRKINLFGNVYYFDKADSGYRPIYTRGGGAVFRWDIYQSSGNVVLAPTSEAVHVAEFFYLGKKLDGAGKAPRRGPTDLLRKFILFGFTLERLLIGPHIFRNQPAGIMAANRGSSVPDLLEAGGTKIADGSYGSRYPMQYWEHPYVMKHEPMAIRKFSENIEKMDRRLQG